MTDTNKVANPPVRDSIMLKDAATETFRGSLNDKEVVFSHSNYQTYVLKTGDESNSGKMNTERGYGDDRDATVYVLNSDKPKAEQQYFVRNSNGSVYMLDKDRFVVDGAVFELAKKPAQNPQNNSGAEEKQANKIKPAKSGDAKTQKDAVQKKSAVKKPARKTINKSKKKKKVVKKTRKKKKARNKTQTTPPQNQN